MVSNVRRGLGVDVFAHSCSICGAEVRSWSKREMNYTCSGCKTVLAEKEKGEKDPLNKLLAERRLEIAKDYLRRKKITDLYTEFMGVIEKNLHRPGWFQSSNEILVGLELLRNGIEVRHQVRMGRWKADFVIPDLKIVLEVDGEVYHQGDRAKKDKLKDAAIIANLGPEWEVIRITEDMLKKKLTRLMPAIDGVIESRKRVRKSHDQKLPKWYSEKHW